MLTVHRRDSEAHNHTGGTVHSQALDPGNLHPQALKGRLLLPCVPRSMAVLTLAPGLLGSEIAEPAP